jgi:DNA-binding transcriptional ArsR family regulator
MVKYSESLDNTFGALADPTRRAILASLLLGQASITELAKPHQMSLPAVIKHLRVLEQAGLVSQKKSGRTRQCQLIAEPLRDAEQWINQYRVFWQYQFASLDRYLRQEQENEKGEDRKWPPHKRSKKQNSK